MANFDHNLDPWEQDSYETGSTQPPKNRGGIIAVTLVAVILLCGIFSAMNALNFRPLESTTPSDPSDGLQFMPSASHTTDPGNSDGPVQAPQGGNVSVQLQPLPEAVENIPQAGGYSLQTIYDMAIDSVVSITCTTAEGSAGGTGVVLSRDGYLVTNCHVVVDALDISVLLTDGRTFSAAIVGVDHLSDLAVLYIEAGDLSPAQFGDSATIRVGDAVAAIGDPLGIALRGTMTDGIISAINRDIVQSGWTMSLIQTNAALNSGNSGGPLLNCFGQVIGINTMKISAFSDSAGVEGLGFAIPSATVKEVAEQLIAQGYVSGRPRMGVTMQNISSQYLKYYNLPAGIRITQVEADSPAQAAGLKAGDILLAVGSNRVTSIDEVNKAIYAHKPGDTVQLTLYRHGQQLTVNLTLGEAGA